MSTQPFSPDDAPLAYFITVTCYGTWLHGSARGSVDPQHNQPETPWLSPDVSLEHARRDAMDQPPYRLDASRRRLVLRAIEEVCAYRGWTLLAAHVRTTHVHIVVQASAAPEKVMNDFKAYASRALNAAGCDENWRKRWTRHGSTRYLWKSASVAGAVHYTLHEQGEPMETFEGSPTAEPRPSGSG